MRGTSFQLSGDTRKNYIHHQDVTERKFGPLSPYTPVRFQQLLNIADCNAFSIIHPLAVFISKKAHLVTYDEYGIRL